MTDERATISEAIPDYVIERELGRGGMGVVFLARHQRLGRAVAIKELPPSFASEAAVRERFSTEAKTLASLSHPHIVPIFDYVEREGLCLIVMEQLPGGTVWERFTTTGLTPPTACAVVLACCAALEHAHGKGVLHLDVKPDNLMFDSEAAVKVTDFGISRVISGDDTLTTAEGQVLGTPAYMSPEQARGDTLTAASDVYSAAVMLYELLSGRLPWSGAQTAADLLRQRLDEDPEPLRAVASHVPQVLADAVMRGLEREPQHRFRTAEEFGVAIAEACAQAWGPNWLDYAEIRIVGSDRLTRAARTTGEQAVTGTAPAATPTATAASGTARETVVGGQGTDARVAPETTITGGGGEQRVAPETTVGAAVPSADRVAPETVVTGGAATPATGTPAPPPAPPPVEPPQFEVVRAAGVEERIDGADLNQFRPADFVSVADLFRPPPSGRTFWLVSLLFVVAALFAAASFSEVPEREGTIESGQVRVAGQDVTTGRLDLDLAEDLPVEIIDPGIAAFAGRAELEISVMGVPLGSAETDLREGAGVFEPKISRYLAAGSVEGEVRVFVGEEQVAGSTFPATATHPWYLTATGLAAVLVVLAGIANLESSIKPLRRGRGRKLAVIGAGISGAMIAVGGIMLAGALGRGDPTPTGLVATGALAAVAAGLLAIGTMRSARRKRTRIAVKRAERALRVRSTSV